MNKFFLGVVVSIGLLIPRLAIAEDLTIEEALLSLEGMQHGIAGRCETTQLYAPGDDWKAGGQVVHHEGLLEFILADLDNGLHLTVRTHDNGGKLLGEALLEPSVLETTLTPNQWQQIPCHINKGSTVCQDLWIRLNEDGSLSGRILTRASSKNTAPCRTITFSTRSQ